MSLLSLNGLLQPLLITIIALICARLLVRDTSASDQHQFAALDGLRGLIALLVFVHHSVFWFYYSRGAGWHGGDSVLYGNFGQTSICLFFMLSGFLFGHKLLDARLQPLDWLRLFCSRILRLTPLYFALLLVMFAIIAFESGFTMHQSNAELLVSLRNWLLFTIPSRGDINGYPDTHLMTAGVVWTLPYEWYFYLCLPLVAMLLGSRSTGTPLPWLLLSFGCLLTFSQWGLDPTLLWGFAGGLAAAWVARTATLRQIHSGRGMDWIVLSCLLLGYTCFDNGQFYTRLLILTVGLSCIASGSSLFGLLTSRACRALSTISYGIYLLHGLVLYLLFHFVLGTNTSQQLSEQQHVLLMLAITPVIIAMASASWYWIEWPAIRATGNLTRLLRHLHQPGSISTNTKEPPAPTAPQLPPTLFTPRLVRRVDTQEERINE